MTSTLFLHGFGTAGRSWDAVRAHLPAPSRGRAPDLPGFGACPDLPTPDFDAYVAWIAEQAAALDGPVLLVAHSMSGKLALRVAAERTDLVGGLVLVAPSTPGAEPMQPGDRHDIMASFGDANAAGEAIRSEARNLEADALARLVEDRLAVSRGAWNWWQSRGSLLDIGPDLARVGARVTVVVGADDARLGEAAQRRHLLNRLRPETRLRVVAMCGHFVPVEQPAALAAAITEHVS